MTRKLFVASILCVAVASVAVAQNAPDRCSSSEKGSLVIFPKVEIRWDATGALIQDTFLDLTNDWTAGTQVQMYFVNGDPALAAELNTAGEIIERAHPGCNNVDAGIALTANQPYYWSAATGQSGAGFAGVQPFTVLDPAGIGGPGRPDPNGSGDRVLRGFVIAYAVDANGKEVTLNHLKGDAMIVNYNDSSAWEYNAFSFARAATAPAGDYVLDLNKVEYDQVFDELVLDFYATGATLASGAGKTVTVEDTDLTLLPLIDLNLREGGLPKYTKVEFNIWNQWEHKLSGSYKCIGCWDQDVLSNYPVPNQFGIEILGTDKAKARIDGISNPVCPESVASPLLGLAAKYLSFGTRGDYAVAGMNVTGSGYETGKIQVEGIDDPDEILSQPVSRPAVSGGLGRVRVPLESNPLE